MPSRSFRVPTCIAGAFLKPAAIEPYVRHTPSGLASKSPVRELGPDACGGNAPRSLETPLRPYAYGSMTVMKSPLQSLSILGV